MSAKKVQIMLDLLLNLKSDKSQAAQIAKEMEQNLKNINPKISIDSDKFRKGITDILGEFDKLEKSALDFDKILSNIDIDFDSDQAEQAMKKLAEMMKNAGDNLGDLDLSKFEEALGSLGDEDIEQIGEKLKEAFDNFDANSLKKQIKGIEDETELMKLNVEKATAEYNKQRSTVALLAKAGKENTDEYKEALAELKKRGDELKKIKKSEEDIGKAVEGTKEKMSVMNKLSQFGLASEGIQNFAQSVNEVSAPFMELDKATQAMKTLGPEAKELSGELRTVSVQMAKDLPFSAGQFQEAMGNAMASGIKGGVEGLSGFAETAAKLATGGMAELPAVVQGLGATLNAFGASSSEAGQYADWMFNIVNAGVTTIDELNQYMSGVTPTAASMGVAFKDVGGALALMTQKGVPTASAVTKLNAALIEMAKPSAGIQQALTAVGISTEDFAKQIKEKGLTSALQTLDTGFKKLGKSATQMFSSSEAGAAFNVLMGDVNMLNDTMDAVANTAGSTQAAYDEMAQSIEVRTKQMKAQFDSLVIGVIDSTGVIGEYTMVAGQVFSQLSPTITALAGFKSLLPTEAIGDFVKSLLTKLVPGLFATAAAETAAGTAGTTAGAATAAAWAAALWPLLAITAGIGVLIAIVAALVETDQERLEKLESQNKALEEQSNLMDKKKKDIATNQELIKQYEELGSKTNKTVEEQKKFDEVQLQIAKNMPGVINQSKSFVENLQALKQKSGDLNKELESTNKKMEELKEKKLQLKIEINQQNMKMAADEIDDILDFYGKNEQDLQINIGKIKTAQSKEELDKYMTDLKLQIFNSKEFSKLDQEEQAEINKYLDNLEKSANDSIEAKTNQMKQKAGELGKAIAEGSATGLDTEETEKKIKEIAEKTGKSYEEVKKEVTNQIVQTKKAIKEQKLGDILKESAEIKGNLNNSQKLDDLVKQFENAKTDVEKASIAEAIKKQAPDAIKATGSVITAEGKLVNTYSVVTDKIKESSDAQKERYSNNLSSKQQEFINTILQESDAYGKNIEEMNRLKAERDKLASQGLDTSQIDQQINALGAKNQAFTNEVLNNIIKWESQGQDTTEVYDQVAKTLGKSPEEVKKLVEKQKETILKQKEMNKEATKLADIFGEAEKKAQESFNQALNESKSLILKIREAKAKGNKEDVARFSAELKEKRAIAKEFDKQSDKLQAIKESEESRYNQEVKSAYELAKIEVDKQKSILELRNQEKILDDEALRLEENRQETVWDSLVLEKDKLDMLEAQKASLEKAYQITKDENGKLVIGIKAGKGEKKSEIDEAVTEEINNINQSIKEAKNSVKSVEIQIELDKKDIEKQLAEYEIEKTVHQIELGIKGTEEFDNLISLSKKQVDLTKDALQNSVQTIDDLQAKMAVALITAGVDEKQKQAIKNKYDTLINEEKRRYLELLKSVDEAETKVNDLVEKKIKARMEILKREQEKETTAFEKNLDKKYKLFEEFRNAYAEGLIVHNQDEDDREIRIFEAKLDKKLKKLDEYREQDVISEEEYEEQKTKLEEEANKKREKMERERRVRDQMNQEMFNSMQVQLEKNKENEKFSLEKRHNDETLAEIESSNKAILDANGTNMNAIQKMLSRKHEIEKEQIESGNKEKNKAELEFIEQNLEIKLNGLSESEKMTIKDLGESNATILDKIKENTDITATFLEEGQSAISTAMAKMFAGDSEGAVDALKGTFGAILGTTAEYLRKEVDAQILKFFLDWFDSTDAIALPWFVKLGMLPAIQAIASGAIHGIADPIINRVASFSTGGRIDEPTLAVVGDASRLGGLNREWVFRDEQLQQVVNSALSHQNNSMARELAEIKALLAGQELSATLKGTDIRLAQRRTQNAVDRRAR